MYDVVVIGGGAAGFFAAIKSAELGCNTLILEKSKKLLSKVRVSGGGRCNVTHHCFDPIELVKYYPRGEKELLGPFHQFGPADMMEWLEGRGVALKTEQDGRMFPVTDSSQTIIDCFIEASQQAGVEIRTGWETNQLIQDENNWVIGNQNGETIKALKVIITTGGMSNNAPVWLQQLDIAIISGVPSLFTFNIPDTPYNDLQGIAIANAMVKVSGANFQFQGPLLFTHWGLSGPVVLKLSAWAARFAHEHNYKFQISVAFTGEHDTSAVLITLKQYTREAGGKSVIKYSYEGIPSRLWIRMCELCGLHPKLNWGDLNKEQMQQLALHLSAATFEVSGKTTFKEEFVTCGGVDLKSVNMKTMESKKYKGLFFAGEVLNIDGITGGFNFQAAWTTGWIAGTNAAQ